MNLGEVAGHIVAASIGARAGQSAAGGATALASSGCRRRPRSSREAALAITRAARVATSGGMRSSARILIGVGALIGSALASDWLYRRYVRAWVLTWGATDDEIARRLPGDELLESADIVATRAIGIDAPPSAIWPWLVQMGPGRAGAYTYDWIENQFGLNMHSADRIVSELQKLEVGDVLRGREGQPGMRVEILEPERVLSSRSEAGDWVWTFALAPDNGASRLISRNRIAMKGAQAGQRLGMLVMEPGSLVMERKMLLGIKQRAEQLAAEESSKCE